MATAATGRAQATGASYVSMTTRREQQLTPAQRDQRQQRERIAKFVIAGGEP